MRVALAQMNVVANQPERNVDTMLRMIEEAKGDQVDLVAFPEMCIGGYLLADRWLTDDFCLDLMAHHKPVIDASDGIAVAFGNVYLDHQVNDRVGDDSFHPNKDGRTRKYNAVYVVHLSD